MEKISHEEFKRLMEFYSKQIPRLNWFEEPDREAIVLEASKTSKRTGENFFSICANIAHMRSVEWGKKPPK